MDKKFARLNFACYTTNISMSVVANISPLLFVTFNSIYKISYSLLGLLVLINFVTQLTVDLIFSFFSHKFNISKTVKFTPLLCFIGLFLYAVLPIFFPNHTYICLVIGTIIFSASGGLCEVLISPVIAAIPSKDPDRQMSKLHSIYAWGVVGVIIFSTLFLMIFGSENWNILAIIFMFIPILSSILFLGAEVPQMETPEKVSGVLNSFKNKKLWFCIIAIFLGGSSECTMAQWSSGFLEQALKIPKVYGDIFGVAMFATMLGFGRTLYSKIGKNIGKVLFFGAIGTVLCYFIVSVTNNWVIGIIACALTGFCVSMMWPGCLIVATEYFKSGNVFIFALMAAAGDLGASVGPQLVGIITDKIIGNPICADIASSLSLTTEQLGLKVGILFAMLFPLCAIPLYYKIMKKKH